jgi:hypothetical protein
VNGDTEDCKESWFSGFPYEAINPLLFIMAALIVVTLIGFFPNMKEAGMLLLGAILPRIRKGAPKEDNGS